MVAKNRPILEDVVDAFQRTTGLAVRLVLNRLPPDIDGIITIEKGGKHWRLEAEEKLHLTRERVALWETQRPRKKGKRILVVDFVPPTLADQLKQMNMAFIDEAGNAYVNLPGLYVFVKGNRPAEGFAQRGRQRAFKPTGLRVIYALLCNPGLENRTYREIAAAANVALGTVHWAMKDLAAQGYVMEMENRTEE